jgi:hypothetical protein
MTAITCLTCYWWLTRYVQLIHWEPICVSLLYISFWSIRQL